MIISLLICFRVLELGAGTGIIGIILLLLGAEVHFTDKQILLPLIQHNIDVNASHINKNKIRVKELIWGQTIVEDKYDIIIACDCVYESQEMWMPLANCLNQIATNDTDVIMSYELRSRKDAAFFPHISKTFTVTKVPGSDLDDFWQSPDIGVFHLRKREIAQTDTDTREQLLLGDLKKRQRVGEQS